MCLRLDRLIAFMARLDRIEACAWDRASLWAIFVLALVGVFAVL